MSLLTLTRTPLGEIKVPEHKPVLDQFPIPIPKTDRRQGFSVFTKVSSNIKISMRDDAPNPISIVQKNMQYKDLVYSDSVSLGNKVKLVPGKETGSVLKKPIQKAMIAAKSAKCDLRKSMKKFNNTEKNQKPQKPQKKIQENTHQKDLSEFLAFAQMFQMAYSIKPEDKEMLIKRELAKGLQKANSFDIKESSKAEKVERSDLSLTRESSTQLERSVFCINKLVSSNPKTSYAGIKINLVNDSHNYTFSPRVKCIQAII